MKRTIIRLGILLSLFSQLTVVKASEITINTNDENNPHTAYLHQCIINPHIEDKTKDISSRFNTILPNMEFETIKLEKGRKFVVVSEQNLNNNNISGIPVRFESVQKEYLAYDKQPSKIVFQGKIQKTGKPRLAGKSGTVKIKLEKITIDKITYPVEALISKIDNKNVYFNTLSGAPVYLANLADAANKGVINSTWKDPCHGEMCISSHNAARPLVFLGAAALQTADLLLSPVAALCKRGKNVDIPLNTYFEIKLDKDLYVLNL